MNVLVISHMYPSSFNNMSGIFVYKQVKELKKLGCNVVVISPIPLAPFPLNLLSNKWNKYSKVPLKQEKNGIEVYYPRYLEFPRKLFNSTSGNRMYRGIKKLAIQLNNKYKFDILHSHVALPDGYASMILNSKLKIPHIVTIHGQDFQHTIKKSEKLKQRVFEVLQKADAVITVSNKLKNVVKDEKFVDKIYVINNGVDIEDCIYEDDNNTIMDENYINVLSVSNLVKTKGIDYNIIAVSKLIKYYPNIRYYIIGDGIEKSYLKDLVKKLKLEGNIFFKGKLPHKEVMKYMKKCDIFSLPSYEEGFGVVYVECMLQGKPVIGIKGQGIDDVIINYKNGILVNPKDIDDLQKAIKFLIDNKQEAYKIGQNAKKTVINGFTWQINAEKTKKLYEKYVKN